MHVIIIVYCQNSSRLYLPFRGVFDESLIVGDGRYQRWKIRENLLIYPGELSNEFSELLFNVITLNQKDTEIFNCHQVCA